MSEVKFKSAAPGSSLKFGVSRTEENLMGMRVGQFSVHLAPSDAPALCLAILEAAGGRDALGIDVSNAMTDLREYVKEREANAVAEADRVALEAEAFTLFKASGAYGSDRLFLKFSDLDEHVKQCWLAVARAARELNKEDGQ